MPDRGYSLNKTESYGHTEQYRPLMSRADKIGTREKWIDRKGLNVLEFWSEDFYVKITFLTGLICPWLILYGLYMKQSRQTLRLSSLIQSLGRNVLALHGLARPFHMCILDRDNCVICFTATPGKPFTDFHKRTLDCNGALAGYWYLGYYWKQSHSDISWNLFSF